VVFVYIAVGQHSATCFDRRAVIFRLCFFLRGCKCHWPVCACGDTHILVSNIYILVKKTQAEDDRMTVETCSWWPINRNVNKTTVVLDAMLVINLIFSTAGWKTSKLCIHRWYASVAWKDFIELNVSARYGSELS